MLSCASLRLLLVAAAAVVGVSCSLAFPGNEFLAGSTGSGGSASASGAGAGSSTTGSGGTGGGAAETRMYLFSGQATNLVPGGGSVKVAAVSFTSVAEDGSLGPWRDTNDVPLSGSYFAGSSDAKQVFLTGLPDLPQQANSTGQGSTVITLLTAPWTAEGVGTWSATPARAFDDDDVLPLGNDATGFAISPGRAVYCVGGQFGNPTDVVHAVHIDDSSGFALGETSLVQLPWTVDYASPLVVGDVLVVVGGQSPPTHPLSSVAGAVIHGDGTLGNFVIGDALTQDGATPFPIAFTSLAADGDRVYVVGGTNDGGTQRTVLMGRITAPAKLGGWTPQTELVPQLKSAAVAVARGFLFVIGGQDQNGDAVKFVWRSKIQGDGTLGEWTQLGDLPYARWSAQAVVR